MSTYTKPVFKSVASNEIVEIVGLVFTVGYLDIGAARRVAVGQNNQNNIVICKVIEQKQDGIVKLG